MAREERPEGGIIGVHDAVEGLTHLFYDDARLRCGLWITMWKKELHAFARVEITHPTCIVCAAWQPVPLDLPLWRTWE